MGKNINVKLIAGNKTINKPSEYNLTFEINFTISEDIFQIVKENSNNFDLDERQLFRLIKKRILKALLQAH